MKQCPKKFNRYLGVLIFCLLISVVNAEVIYLDSRNGDDANSGSKEQPIKTFLKAAELINNGTDEGGTTVIVAPGVYPLPERVLIENERPFTKADRLTIRAAILPGDADWKPGMMPVLISTQERGTPDITRDRGTSMYGLQVEVSHVTIQGLKFLGNAAPHNRYYPIRRNGKDLRDLEVTQCLFVGDRHALPIHVAIIAHGHELVVEHSIFYNCKNPVVFWNVDEGKSYGNAMRNCIVEGAYRTGVWVVATADDFDFSNNVFNNCDYFFVRNDINQETFHLKNSIVTNYKYYSGYGTAGGPKKETGPEISYREENIRKNVVVKLETGDVQPAELSLMTPNNYLHPAANSAAAKLGAGLFKN